jgi:hypothetical protein
MLFNVGIFLDVTFKMQLLTLRVMFPFQVVGLPALSTVIRLALRRTVRHFYSVPVSSPHDWAVGSSP